LWFDDRLLFHHHIPAEKITWPFLLNLARPGAMVRPYLLIYNGLNVINIDTPENSQVDIYKKYWRDYQFYWLRSAFYSNLTLKDILYTIRVLVKKEPEADHYYFKKMIYWIEFLSTMNFSVRAFNEVFFKLIDLKRSIALLKQRGIMTLKENVVKQ
jgi:hypothetical protein